MRAGRKEGGNLRHVNGKLLYAEVRRNLPTTVGERNEQRMAFDGAKDRLKRLPGNDLAPSRAAAAHTSALGVCRSVLH